MKTRYAGIIVGLILSATTMFALAQGRPGQGQGRNGSGYGGPPRTEQERAARQQACPYGGEGVCAQGGPRGPGLGNCWGQGQGKGQGYGRGLRNGTGPRSQNGTCPLVAPKAAK